MRARIARHGRDHRPGGADPIPGGAGPWPTMHTFFPFSDIDMFDASSWTRTIDTACYTNSYAENSAGANGEYIIWPVRLGPLGSMWSIFLVANLRTDGGVIKFAFSSADDDFYAPGAYNFHTDATFVNAGSGQNLYSATPTKSFTNGLLGGFRIQGADGDALTSISGSDPDYPGMLEFDGGSGLYLFRVKVDGNIAPSTGFVSQISHLALRRQGG